MIEKIKLSDGTIIDFDYDKKVESISQSLKSNGEFSTEEADSVAQNVVNLISEKFVSAVPSQEDFDQLVKLVLRSTPAEEANNVPETTENPSNEQPAPENNYNNQTEPTPEPEQKPEEAKCEDVRKLEALDIPLSEQGRRILEESDVFDELGRSIFLDRYSIKDKRDSIEMGDLVVATTKEDPKFPKKDIGIVKAVSGDKLILHMITGVHADQANNYEFNTTIWQTDRPLESIRDAHKRVARAVASIEKDQELQGNWAKEFLYHLQKKHIQPAGRIMTGASSGEDAYTKNLTLFNCYVIPSPKDSRESIIKETLYQMTEIMSRGGGAGINISSLRPRYAYVKGVHGKSSGSVSWGGIFSYATGLIEQGGSRRGALMLMMHDWHPDIEEFINAKRVKGMIENANISVLVSDKFMDAVKVDDTWTLEFPDYENDEIKTVYEEEWDGNLDEWKKNGLPTKVYKTVRARDLWNQIVTSAHASAEPGIVFIERYNKLSNSHYFNQIICTNPCGEQGLPAWGVCNLGHLYMASFLKQVGEDQDGPLYDIHWEELSRAAKALNRFLDNVIDLTPYHFKENEDNQKAERRVGCGTLGLGEMLIKLRLRYGSSESLELIDKVYKFICEEMYKSSCILAQEKGSFPQFDTERFLESGFVQTLSPEIKNIIREKGIRNVTLITQAPTGTVGTMLGSSTGIEPYYAFEFYQQSRLGFHKVKIPLAKSYINEDGTLPQYFVTALEMDPEDHVKVQAAVQKWTDSSISKTANAPENFTKEDTRKLYELAYKLGCKGVTVYRDKSRSEQILSTDKNTEQKNIESAQATSKESLVAVEASESEEKASEETEQVSQEPEQPSPEPEGEPQSETPEVPADPTEDSAACKIEFDAYGQMKKSCSD